MPNSPTQLFLGKLPAIRPHQLSYIDAYSLGRPPQPPAAVPDPKVADWGMLGNDVCGNCTIAGAAHLMMATEADLPYVGEPTFNTAQVEQQYWEITGGVDTGCVEADVLRLWRTRGLFGGHKIAAFAPVEANNILAVHRAIAFYGTAYIGVQLPESAQAQFRAGEPWTVMDDSPILGGHCIVPVSYDPQFIYCVTWGRLVSVSWAWWATYVDEVWCVIPEAIEKVGHGPTDLNLAELAEDLDRLAA